MAHKPEEYCRLRRQLIEAAAEYEPAGYRTFIERTARSEEYYCQRGRHDSVAYIKWPYRPWRTCTILAPNSGANEKPFSTLERLFSKAWLWLPRVIAEGVVDTAEKHLSPPAELGLYWVRSHYQLWGWLLWFDWLWQCGEVETGEPEVPPAGMDLRPFSYSADLIARWGLDGSAGGVPVWLAPPPAPAPESQPPAAELAVDLVSFDDIRKVLGVDLKTVQNAASVWRKAGHTINNPCSYALIRPLLLGTWSRKAALFPESWADMQRVLEAHN